MSKINSKILDNLYSLNKDKVEKAFNIIYNEYSYLVYYVSLKIVNDSSMAQEITNETFYKFYINKDKVSSYKNIKYYLVTTSRNLSINYVNEQKRITNIEESKACISFGYNGFYDYINQFKDFLNEEEIDILVMHFLYDFSFKEIAIDTNQTIDAISSKYRRTINKVKKYYKGVKSHE